MNEKEKKKEIKKLYALWTDKNFPGSYSGATR